MLFLMTNNVRVINQFKEQIWLIADLLLVLQIGISMRC